MFDSFSPWEWVAVAVAGLAIGYFFLPYLLIKPIFGGWLAGMVFFGIRFPLESGPGTHPERIVASAILWSVMAFCAQIGRATVNRRYSNLQRPRYNGDQRGFE